MHIFLKNVLLLVLIILKLCTCTFGEYSLKNLAVVCGVQEIDVIMTAPPQCTALAIATSDFDKLSTIINIKGNLPVLIIMNTYDFTSMEDSNENSDYGSVFSTYNNVDFDYMVFDYTYLYIPGDSESVTRYTQDVGIFLQQAKQYFPGKGIGLVVTRDVESMGESINLAIVNKYTDLFLLASADYRNCTHHNHQRDMEVLSTKDDILGSLNALKSAAVPLNKTVYTIDIVIQSKRTWDSEYMRYSYLCSNKLSIDRKYCFSTVQNLFEEARLRISEGTAGIYVNSLGFDDTTGSCGCTTPTDNDPTFRALKTIAGASQENINNESFYDCKTGGFPIIQS